jgi:hypothetical protein
MMKMFDDEDVTWEGGKYMTNSRREPCRQLQRKSIIKCHPNRQWASQETCEGERSPMPEWIN